MICNSPSTIIKKNFGKAIFSLCHQLSHQLTIFAALYFEFADDDKRPYKQVYLADRHD